MKDQRINNWKINIGEKWNNENTWLIQEKWGIKKQRKKRTDGKQNMMRNLNPQINNFNNL